MIKRIKSISRRTLAFILTILMLLSSGIVGTLAANVDFVETRALPTTVYLKPGVWNGDGAGFRLDAWDSNNTHKQIDFADSNNDGIYEATLGGNYTDANIYRMSSDKQTIWNRINNIGMPSGTQNCYEITGWGSGQGQGNWTTLASYQKDTNSDWYLRGSFDDWTNGIRFKYAETNFTGHLIKAELTVPAGTYYFKINNGGDWRGKASDGDISDTCTNYQTGTGDNIKFIATGGTYLFEYNTNDWKLTITQPKTEYTVTINNNELPASSKIYINGSEQDIDNAQNISFPVTEGDTIKVVVASPTYWYISKYDVTVGTTKTSYLGESSYYTYQWYSTKYETTVNDNITIDLEHTHNPDVITGTVTDGGAIAFSGSGYNSYDTSVSYKGQVICTATPTNADYYVKSITAKNDAGNVVEEFTNTNKEDGAQSLTIDSVTENITFSAEFEKKSHTVKVAVNDATKGTAKFDDGTTAQKTVTDGTEVTFVATPTNDGYVFTGWNLGNDTTKYELVNCTLTDATIKVKVKGDFTATASFDDFMPTVSVNVDPNNTFGTATSSAGQVAYGGEVTLTATPASDIYNFVGWTITGSYTEMGNIDLNDPIIRIHPTSNITATAKFSKGNVWTITASADNGGTATASLTEIPQNAGVAVDIEAVAPTGYKFQKWDVTEGTCTFSSGSELTANATIVPESNVTIVAKFVPVSATVTFQSNNTEYGTVSSEGGTATYTNPLTATATEVGTNIFAGWTITGGAEGTDYEAVKVGKTITIKPLKDGKTLTVTANFIDALKAKVYTYSANGFTNLTLKEYNGQTPNPIYSGAQSEIMFDDDTWYTAGQDHNFIPTNNTKVTAQLDLGASSDTGSSNKTVIYIELSSAWLGKYCNNNKIYLTQTASTNSAYADKLNTTDKGKGAYNPSKDTFISSGTHIGNNIYRFELTDAQITNTYGFSIYSDNKYGNTKFWEVSFAHFHYNANSNYYKIGSSYEDYTYNANNNEYKVAVFDVTANGTFATETSEIDVTNAFYSQSGGEWLGHDEVWLYFPNTTSYVATYRRTLANTIASYTTLYNSDNAYGYTTESWNAFTAAYKEAKAALGGGGSYTYNNVTYPISSQQVIDDIVTKLNTKKAALAKLEYITVYTTNGTQATDYKKIGETSLIESAGLVTKGSGLSYTLGTGTNVPIGNYTVKRDQSVTIQCVIQSDFTDYMVAGFVINGNEYEPAELKAGTTNTYIAQHTFGQGGDVIPVYFRKDVVDNTEKAVKVYFKYDPDKFERWGNYVAAYTWTTQSETNTDNNNFRQMGLWPGQVMIPVEGKTGVYYTWVEKNPQYKNESGTTVTESVKGITFDNYGSNSYINTIERVQCYDYYEFVDLAKSDLKYDNITFEPKVRDNVNTNVTNHSYSENEFVDYVNQNGDLMDIFRSTDVTTDDIGLYIVRKGPMGDGGDTNLDGRFYVDCKIYDYATGNYLGTCKSYKLLDVTKLSFYNESTWSKYNGMRVRVDYEGKTGSEVDGNNAHRFDGEWYGYHNISTATITVKSTVRDSVTQLTMDTANLTNECEGGIATINGEASVTLQLNATEKTLRAESNEHYRFVGWYIEKAEDQTIDLTKQASYMANYDIPLDFSTTYVAVFERIPEGTLTVQNFYYTTAAKELMTGEVYADTHLLPPVMGGEDKYSKRTVTLQLLNKDGTAKGDPIVSDNYKAECVVEVGDRVQVSIITTPLFPGDSFYAFYERNNNNGVVNFEEVGTDSQPSYAANETATYTYIIDIEDKVDIRTYTIYSDVYHQSTEVVLQYIYRNRFGKTLSYYTKHELTIDECNGCDGNGNKPMFPTTETLTTKSPYVDDLFKDVLWKVSEVTKNNKHFTIVAEEPDQFTVNLQVGSKSRKFEGAFNDSISVYASDINKDVTNKQGVWFIDNKPENGSYDKGTDTLLAYGNYYGFVITDDMTICYDDKIYAKDIGFKTLLQDAVYGREQTTSADGTGLIDKIYVDYLISYLVPHFDKEVLDGVKLNDRLNSDNTPVMLETLEQAGYTVDYGIVLELINTKGPDDENYTEYFGTDKTDLTKVENLINKMDPDDAQAEGQGTKVGNKLKTYYYVWSHKSQTNEISNKNRLLMTFKFDNNEANQAKYFNAIAYLKLTDKNGNTECYFSNQGTLNIKETGNINEGVIVPPTPTT